MGRSERKRSIKKTVIISAAAGLLVLCLAVMITVHVLLKQNFPEANIRNIQFPTVTVIMRTDIRELR